jgi:DNA-binding phage protein
VPGEKMINLKERSETRAGTDSRVHHRLFAKLMKNKRAQEAYEAEGAMFDFIEKIKAEMTRKHMTYYAVAKKAEIDHQVLARILNGQKNAEISTLAKVAHGVGAKLELVLQR